MGDKGRIYIPNQNMPRICPELAAEIGLNESILLLQLDYWISVAGKERDGCIWIYESLRDLQSAFPFWSRPTINRAVHSLENQGLIKTTDAYNRRQADKTRWFSLEYDAIAKLSAVNVADLAGSNCDSLVQNETELEQIDTTLEQNEPTLPHVPHASPEKSAHEGALRGASAPARAPPSTPSSWPAWEKRFEEAKNLPAFVRYMCQILYPKHDLPDFGQIGAVAKRMGRGRGGYHRLMEILWKVNTRPPTGDLLPYCLGVHQGKEQDKARDAKLDLTSKEGRKAYRVPGVTMDITLDNLPEVVNVST